MISRTHRLTALVYLSPFLIAAAGCEATKSADPLSPSVAGPIPGVNITAPTVVSPSSGAKISIEQQPLTLVASNASTSGVRPLTYTFDVATDAGFTNVVFSREGVAPGGNGQTSLRLADTLATGRTYYWRARAQDGANTGPYSGAANFDVFTPILIDAPTIVSPAKIVVTDDLHPVFTVRNAPRSGPIAGTISYTIELSDTDGFTNRMAVWTAGEQPNQTVLVAPQDLQYSRIYFWRARAYDGNNVQGPWSAIEAFRTPTPRLEGPLAIFPPTSATVDNQRPKFLWQNASRPTDLGYIAYTVEVSDTDTFASKIAVWTVGEQPNQTSLDSPIDLGPSRQFFWRVRGASQTVVGGWSQTMAFKTPAPPVVVRPPTGGGGGGNGNWQACGSTPGDSIVKCVRDAVYRSDADTFEVTKRVAWLLRGQGYGLLIKNAGDNIQSWQGYSFSTSRVALPNGQLYKIISDAGPGGANGATWADNGFIDPKMYVPAIDPSK